MARLPMMRPPTLRGCHGVSATRTTGQRARQRHAPWLHHVLHELARERRPVDHEHCITDAHEPLLLCHASLHDRDDSVHLVKLEPKPVGSAIEHKLSPGARDGLGAGLAAPAAAGAATAGSRCVYGIHQRMQQRVGAAHGAQPVQRRLGRVRELRRAEMLFRTPVRAASTHSAMGRGLPSSIECTRLECIPQPCERCRVPHITQTWGFQELIRTMYWGG